jgi:aminopeptidase N
VREFAFAAGPNLEPVVRSVDGVDVRYFGTSVGVTTSTSDALALAVESLAAFDRLWGPYPYAELDIVETDVSLGGYEFSGLVMLDAATRERGPADAVRWLLVHEIAHQWWYGIVGSHTVEEPWLDEAFATYAVPLALARSDADASAALIDSWRTTYGEATRAPAIGSSASDFSSWRSYRDPVYYRGAILLDDYRRQMGDAEFGALLRAAQARFRWRHLTTADFAALADEFSPGAGDAIRSIAPDD